MAVNIELMASFAPTAQRAVLETCFHLGRCLIAEVKRMTAYRHSRNPSDNYSDTLARYFNEFDKCVIDRDIWKKAALTLNEPCHLGLQMLEHVVTMMPHSTLSLEDKLSFISDLNKALRDYVEAITPRITVDSSNSAEYLHETISKALNDSLLVQLDVKLTIIKRRIFEKSNVSLLEECTLLDASAEDLTNALYCQSPTGFSQSIIDGDTAKSKYFTTSVAEIVLSSDDEDEGSEPPPKGSVYFNITYPRYLPARSTSDDKSYDNMDFMNESMLKFFLYTIAIPMRNVLSVETTETDVSKLPTVCIALEMLCTGLVDLFSRNVIESVFIARYRDNLLAVLSGFERQRWIQPEQMATPSTNAFRSFKSMEMCFLMPMNQYGFIRIDDTSRISADGYTICEWQDDEVLSMKQMLDSAFSSSSNSSGITHNHPKIASLADIPLPYYAVPLTSSYGLHTKYIEQFKNVIQGMSSKIIMDDLWTYQSLPLVLSSKDRRLWIPEVCCSTYYDLMRCIRGVEGIEEESRAMLATDNNFPSFLRSKLQHEKALADAEWMYSCAQLPEKQYRSLCATPSSGWGSAIRLYERSLNTKYADIFMSKFMLLLDKLIELFAGNNLLFGSFLKCKNLLGGAATSPSTRMKIITGFAGAMQGCANDISKYCSLLNVFRAVDNKVRSASMTHKQKCDSSFVSELKQSVIAPAATYSRTDDKFNSESVVVFKWDDLELSDSPAEIVCERNSVRASMSLLIVAMAIDDNLRSNSSVNKLGLSLHLQESLQILAEKEMFNEDEGGSDMDYLKQVFDLWVLREGPPPPFIRESADSQQQYDAYLGKWLSVILDKNPPFNTSADPELHALPWFSIEPYMRFILIDSWYLPYNSKELSVSSDECLRRGLAVAPLSLRRRPLLLDASGPLSVILDMIGGLCASAVSFIKVYLDDQFSQQLESTYNKDMQLQSLKQSTIQLVVPQLITSSSIDSTATSSSSLSALSTQWSEVLEDIVANEPHTDLAGSMCAKFIGAIIFDYGKISAAVTVALQNNGGMTYANIIVRCLRIVIDVVVTSIFTRFYLRSDNTRKHVFQNWTAYWKSVDMAMASDKNLSFSNAISKVAPVEFQKLMLPPGLVSYVYSGVGDYTSVADGAGMEIDALCDAKTTSKLLQVLGPLLKLTNSSSDGLDVDTLMRLKSDGLNSASEDKLTLREFIDDFFTKLEEGLSNPQQ